MRLAYFTPLPPGKSGIADYNAELLPYLARGADITVFVEHERELRANRERTDYLVRDIMHFEGMHAEQPFDLCIYHQGNNPYHEYIYDQALKTPGLVVLHEHCLHHLLTLKTLDRDDEQSYREEMFQAYGRNGARLADARERGISSDYQQFVMPMNYHLLARSLGVIVHNQYAADNLEIPETLPLAKRLPGALPAPPLVQIIPHHLSPKVYELDDWDKNDCRAIFRLPAEGLIFGAFGFVTEAKRLPVVLKAFKRLLKLVPNAIFVIVGEDHWQWSIAPLIAELDLESTVRITGYTNEREFFQYLKAVDVVVNLRYPTAGESSGTLIRAMGAGKPVIVSDFGQHADLPDEICLKVPLDDEEEVLYQHFRRLAYQPVFREHLGERAKKYVRRECEISRCAAGYLSFAERVIQARATKNLTVNQVKATPKIACDFDAALHHALGFFSGDEDSQEYIRHHRHRLLDTLQLIPRGDGSQRLLELSSYLMMPPLLQHYGKYAEIEVTGYWQDGPDKKHRTLRNPETNDEINISMQRLNVERDEFPYPDEYFDVALCCELIEHLSEDPMHMMIELNRVLKWGGLVIVTTPNISSAISVQAILQGCSPYIYGNYNRENINYGLSDRHNREYTPQDIHIVFEAGGFEVVELFTKDTWNAPGPEILKTLENLKAPLNLRGDNIFAVGRKISSHTERYPRRIYD